MQARFSRRALSAAGLGLAGVLALPAARTRAQDDPKRLRILGWPSYFRDDITAPFREANDVRIEVTGIGTPDDTMLFLRAGGVGFYDIVAPSIGLVNPLGEAGLLAALDPAAIPSNGGLFPQLQQLPPKSDGRTFGIPLIWGTLALAYASSGVSEPPAEWTALLEEPYAGELVMPDDALGHYWIWNWALGAEDPTRVSRKQLDNTTQTLIQLKQQRAVAFGGSSYDSMMKVADGTGLYSTVGWQSAPLLTRADQRPLATAAPEPGGASFCDCIAMVTDAHDPELATQFIDFMLSAETQSRLIDITRWATVAQAAPPLIQPDIGALYAYDQLDVWLARSPIRGYPPVTDDGSGIATYLDWVLAWDRVRQARF